MTNATETASLTHDPRVLAARIVELFAAALVFQGCALAWATELALTAPTLDARLAGIDAMAAAGATRSDLVAASDSFRLALGMLKGWDLDEYRRIAAISADFPLPVPAQDFGTLPLGCWGDCLDAATFHATGTKRERRRFAKRSTGSTFTAACIVAEAS